MFTRWKIGVLTNSSQKLCHVMQSINMSVQQSCTVHHDATWSLGCTIYGTALNRGTKIFTCIAYFKGFHAWLTASLSMVYSLFII